MSGATYRGEQRVVFTPVGDGTGLLLHLGTKVYFTLNKTGVVVWKRLEVGPATVSELVDALQARFDGEADAVRADVEALLVEMKRDRLVTVG